MSPAAGPSDQQDDRAHPHPVRLPALVGHAHAEHLFLDAYRSERLHHAWLIGGPRGVGKASLAWHLSRFLLAWPDPKAPDIQQAVSLAASGDGALVQRLAAGSHGDLVVLEPQWNEKSKKLYSEIRVDDVRGALGLFQRASGSGGYRICIIDSAEDLNRSSANALLKVIEEPPPRSLFLIVAHNPGQVMPTLLSRCRRLILSGLTEPEIVAAIQAIGPEWSSIDPIRLQDAAARARGSVGEALRLLQGQTLDLDDAVQGLLRRLPDVDWRRVHRLADSVGMSQATFDVVLRTILDWLGAQVRARAATAASPRALAGFAEAWDLIRAASREAETLNLDKRPLLLSIFADLARIARTA